MKRDSLNKLVLVANILALTYIAKLLENFLPKMPQGGSIYFWLITLIVGVYVIRNNKSFKSKIEFIGGITTLCFTLFIVVFITGQMSYFGYNIESIIFDYVLIYTIPVLVLPILFWNNKFSFVIYSFVVGLLIFISHIISGIIAYNIPVVASIIYNAWYMVPTIIIMIIVGFSFEIKKIKG